MSNGMVKRNKLRKKITYQQTNTNFNEDIKKLKSIVQGPKNLKDPFIDQYIVREREREGGSDSKKYTTLVSNEHVQVPGYHFFISLSSSLFSILYTMVAPYFY